MNEGASLDGTLQNCVEDCTVGDLDKISSGEGVARIAAMNVELKEEQMTDLDIPRQQLQPNQYNCYVSKHDWNYISLCLIPHL